jgi:ribose 5-phosphate isomerase B
MNSGPVWIGNDHGGYELKLRMVGELRARGFEVNDCGSASTAICRYPHYAAKVAGAVAQGRAWRGILICSTGIGMSIIANKFAGVRASLCTSVFMARMTRAHNDSNVLCIGGRITAESDALEMMDTWLSTPYEGGRHNISLGLIASAETELLTGKLWAPEIPD